MNKNNIFLYYIKLIEINIKIYLKIIRNYILYKNNFIFQFDNI